MMINGLEFIEATVFPIAVAWLLTFTIHSTLLLGSVWVIERYVRSFRLKELLWKAALLGGILTATLQVFWGGTPLAAQSASTLAQLTYEQGEVVLESWELSGLLPSNVTSSQSHLALGAWNSAGWLVGLWLAGAAAAGTRFWVATRRFYAGLGPRRDISTGPLADALAQLSRVTGVRRRVRLTCSPHIASPIALTGREICLPQGAITQLDDEQQKSLLAHELAHVVRGDPVWLIVGGVLECLFFFHPLLRLARRRMQECAEYLCDDRAARYTGNGLTLARCLVEVARWPRSAAQPVAVSGMARNASGLERRVRRLLADSWATRAEVPRWWWAALVLGLLVIVGCAGPGVSAPVDNASPVNTELDTFVWPVEGEIAQSYSDGHLALDIKAETGTPVVAAAGGVVVTAEWGGGFGNLVILDHGDGLATYYAHLSDIYTSAGQVVERGDVIGAAGSTGWSTGPHLHFEVRQDDERIDPLPLLPGDGS